MSNNITRADLDVVIKYLSQEDPRLTHGPLVRKFEEEWSNWLGVKYSVMVNSGASANDLTMLALRELRGVGEIIVPPLTWVSDVASVLHAGHKPVFVDINPQTLGLDAEQVLAAITPNTKGVFLTHVLGYDALSDILITELNRLNIPLIEDVCESHGATHNGEKVGSFGLVSNFSFYYAHHMTTIEGGIISTNDDEFYDLIRMMRSHGMVRESLNEETKSSYAKNFPDLNPDFIFAASAHNMRSTEINALIGLEQLKRLDANNLVRTKNLKHFLAVLNQNIFRTDFKIEGSSNYAFTLVLKDPNLALRDKVEFKLRESGIEFRRGLSGGGNQLRQPYLKGKFGVPAPEQMTVTDHVHHYSWYIGNYPELDASKIDWLGSVLSEV